MRDSHIIPRSEQSSAVSAAVLCFVQTGHFCGHGRAAAGSREVYAAPAIPPTPADWAGAWLVAQLPGLDLAIARAIVMRAVTRRHLASADLSDLECRVCEAFDDALVSWR